MARAIRKPRGKPVSPTEIVAKHAEELASDRFGLKIDGREYVTEIDGEYAVNAAKLYQKRLAH